MRIFLDFIFLVFSLFYVLAAFAKRKPLSCIKKRIFADFSGLKKELHGKRPVWLHAVSVGETISASVFVELLCDRFPEEKIIVSTVTSSANAVAEKILPPKVKIIYLPLDLSFIVRKAVSCINPKFFILTETEIWPNLIIELNRKNIPIAVINGRISRKSFIGYKLAGFLFKPIFKSMKFFCVKSDADASRIVKLGASAEKVKVTGSTKFDLALSYKISEEREESLKRRLNISSEETVFLCGSTHEPEEKIIARVFTELRERYPKLKLILAPRHVERVAEISKFYEARGLKYKLFSSLAETNHPTEKIIILDEVGILRDLYAVCSFAFIGGSLTKRGGHNMLEAAGFGKGVIFGKWIYNFEQEADLLLKAGAALMVENEQELKKVLYEILSNREKQINLGNAAYSALKQNSGANEENLKCLKKFL
ncbi:MAG: 3-deoxy-D-manno-octulosonic acid transferase [Candidatus Omnitrophota bacterium]